MPQQFPDRPYQKIGTDLFQFDGRNYLLTIDYYSRFFEIDHLPDTLARTVIHKLKQHMSRNGICDICISDNGPQYSSAEFAQFARDWGFRHETSSPMHPMTNGLAEKGVSIAKKILAKARDTRQDPYLFLLEYRNTPLECGYTPAQLLIGRRTKSVVPVTDTLLNPSPVNRQEVQNKVTKSKQKQKHYFDRHTKSLPELDLNDSVRLRHNGKWIPAKIVTKHNQRSYTVQTNNGALYRRNRRLLMKTHETSPGDVDFQVLDHRSLQEIPNDPLGNHSQTDPPDPINNNPPRTRSGRIVRKPMRFIEEH